MKTLCKKTIGPLFEGSSGKGPLDRAPGCDGDAASTHNAPTLPGTAVAKDGQGRRIFSATAKVYPRHSIGCPKRDDKDCKDCGCPKWIYENYDGTDRRYSAKTRSWSKADKIRQEIEDSHDPVKAELKKLKETQQTKRIPISDAAESYFSDVAARHLARSTQRKHRLTVGKRLLPWSEQNGLRYLDELTVPQLTKFRSTWTLAPKSSQIEKERAVAFFEFCVRQGWLERNPARLLTRIQVKSTPTDYFTREEFEKLVNATRLFVCWRNSRKGPKSIWPTLMRTMVLLMRWSGLRISDAVNLERSRLVGDKILLYQHKTGQPVYVPLPCEVAKSLREIPLVANTTSPRFFFRSGHCSESADLDRWERDFRQLFKVADIREADGTPKLCHAHQLRDTFAIENLLAGVPIDQVSILLGHASIKTTERHYAPWVRARQEQLEQSVAKAHAVQGITKSATDVADLPRIESEIAPAVLSEPKLRLRRKHQRSWPRTEKVTAARSGSAAGDPKRGVAAKRARTTIHAKRKASRPEKIGGSKSKAA